MSRSLTNPLIPIVSLNHIRRIGLSELREFDEETLQVFGTLKNRHTLNFGKTGYGKDGLSQVQLDIDMHEGITPIIFDVKREYPLLMFLQQDPLLAKKLREKWVLPISYKINYFIPYTSGLEKDKEFKKLLRIKHPKISVRPFRININDIQSYDTKTWMLQMTQSQALAKDEELKEKLSGISKKSQEFKESVGKKVLILDEYNMHKNKEKPSLDGWEYLNFEEVLSCQRINVFDFSFMFKDSNLVATSTGVGMLNEFLSRAMNPRKNMFSIYITEWQLWTPEGISQLEGQVKALKYRVSQGGFLMRSFYCRMRINLQNLNAINTNISSQYSIYLTRTENTKDLRILRQDYRVPEHHIQKIMNLRPGMYYDLSKRQFFTVTPKAHKARGQETLLKAYKTFRRNPENFLFYYEQCYMSDILEYFWKEKTIDMKLYRRKAKEYFRSLDKEKMREFVPPDWKAQTTTQVIDKIKKQKAEILRYN